MWTLSTLGRIALRDTQGAELDELLRQPKRLALLVYLCFPAPGAWHRRDELVACFWPEFDSQRARTALRNAIYVLRQALGDGVIRGRGDEEVSVDPALISCDAAGFQSDIAEGRCAAALDRYQGDLLAGLFVTDAAGFENWLDRERQSLRAAAHQAAIRHAADLEARGDPDGAVGAIRRALELDGHDESALRRLLVLLDRTGDRAGALSAFERFTERLRADLDVAASPETVRLAATIRHRVGGPEEKIAPAIIPAADPVPPAPAAKAAAPRRFLRWAAAGLAAVAIGALGLAALTRPKDPGDHAVLLILPMEHQDLVDSLQVLAAGLTTDLTERLARIPGIAVRPAANEAGDLRGSALVKAAGRASAGTVLKSNVLTAGDSIALRFVLLEGRSAEPVWSGAFLSHLNDLEVTSSRITAAIAGQLLGKPLPPLDPRRPVDPESYRLTLQGLQYLVGGMAGTGGSARAEQLFSRAVHLDPTNARAWTGISSVWTARGVQGRVTPADEAFARGESAARKALALDSSQGMAWGNLGVITAVRDGDLAASEVTFRRGMLLEPSNSELHIVLASVLRFAGRYDRAIDEERIAQRLDPMSNYPLEREAFTELCAGRTERALGQYRRLLRVAPESELAYRGIVRSLAALSRWDEAIAEWRESPEGRENPELKAALATARGREGYWAAVHGRGRKALRAVLREAREGWIAPMHVALAWLRAGDPDSGLAILEREVELGARPLFRLHCIAVTEGMVNLPRYQALARRIPRLGATVRR